MPPDNRIGAVLFDLDGTLVDTAPELADAVNRLREEHGLKPLAFRPSGPLYHAAPVGPRHRTVDDRSLTIASDSEFVKKPTALGISRSGGARNPHVFQYTLRFLRSGGTRPPFA
ncbi:MAG: HAD family hydrolase, partial [Gammaproteobacteria bacterium]